MPRVAAIQIAAGPILAANLDEAKRRIAEAAAAGAGLVVLPENFALMGEQEADKLAVAETDGDGPIQTFLAEQAARHGIWLVGGTIPMATPRPGRVRAASLVYNHQGTRVARYDKIHMFDVTVDADSGEVYVESETTEPGERAVVVDTPFGRLGLAVCYDLRFPELFRYLVARGMEILALPAAFTAATGKAHWGMLLRARAVENLCYVVAAAQGGFHVGGRETYGHSMVVDPWGAVLAEMERGRGVVSADIDLDRLRELRQRFPALQHQRFVCGPP
ncbi:MAG: carbon-nitrogen hydrolase family protein [Gammaproteobacteria bacterium]|nr:carbon-nitrogen hydrolase family protein [Gammaproteobacteria bacterium]